MQVPKLRFKEFTDEWQEKKLNDISNILSGKRIPKGLSSVNYNTGIPYITVSNMGDFFINEKEVQYITKEVEKYILKYKVKTNDIIISVAGTLGKLNIVQGNLSGANLTENCNKITDIDNNFHYLYIYYYIKSCIDKYVLELSTKSSQPKLALDRIRNISISVPSLKEQTKIANFLSLIDKKIELQEKLVNNLQLYKKGLLQKVFSNNLGWKTVKLGDLGTTYTGLSGKSKEDFKNGNSKFITYMNVFSNYISNNIQLENVNISLTENQNKVKYGDIFFTTSSETPQEVGMTSVWLFNYDNIYLNSFCFGFRLNNMKNFNIKFLAYIFRSPLIRKKIIFLAQGSTRYNVSKNELMNLKIPIPSIEEQNKIAELFSSIDDKISYETKKLENLKIYKKGLLQQMFI